MTQLAANQPQQPEFIYWGRREAMNAEVGTGLFYEGKYLVQPVGAAEWDASGANNLTEARAIIAELKAAYPGIKVIAV